MVKKNLKESLKNIERHAGPSLVGDFQLMFVYDFIPLVGCGGPSGAGNSTLSSCSSDIKKALSQVYAKYSCSCNL